MNTLKIIITLCLMHFSYGYAQLLGVPAKVNAIIGDISYVQEYGREPTIASNKNLRILLHLKYVEHLLSQKNVNHLTQEQSKQRRLMLSLLREYWQRGIFPEIPTSMDATPCFIDNSGRICAVGYLIEKTAGRKVAEEINRKFQYYYLLDMEDATIKNWIAKSGLTKLECAMIQPGYDRRSFTPLPIPTSSLVYWHSSNDKLLKQSKLLVKKQQLKMDSLLIRIIQQDSIIGFQDLRLYEQSCTIDHANSQLKEKSSIIDNQLKKIDTFIKWGTGFLFILFAFVSVFLFRKYNR